MSKLIYPKRVRTAPDKWISVTPVISSCHITREDNVILSDVNRNIPHLYSRNCYGWEFQLRDKSTTASSFLRAGLSQAFANLMLGFMDLGYTSIRLDRDGDVVTGKTMFEW